MRRHDRAGADRDESARAARRRARRPAFGSVPEPISSIRISERASACATISASRPRCAENVEVFCAIDCSSPMSVKMRVKRPIVAATAGTCMPQPAIATNSPTILSATVLPPMFGPADDRHADVVVERDRLRHGALVEQRMAAVVHVDRRLVDDRRLDRVHAIGDGRARQRQIEVDVDRDVGADLHRLGADERAQLGEDARDFVFFLRAQRAHAIVRLERFERLDEQRLRRVALVSCTMPGNSPANSALTGTT